MGIVGPTTNEAGNEAEIDVQYHTYAEAVRYADDRAAGHFQQSRDIGVATFFCAAMRRDVWERVGPVDEAFEIGLFEDDDYCARVRAAGLRVVCAEDAFVHHFGEGTFGALVPTGEHARLFDANRRRFEQKWRVRWQSHERRRYAWYRNLVDRIRVVADRALPPGATVLVVSHGDDELLELGAERGGWHFPQTPDGLYAGHHPADSDEAIAHLEQMRERGADFFVVPSTSFWWLEFYDEFRRHLDTRYSRVGGNGACEIFDLRDVQRPQRRRPDEAGQGVDRHTCPQPRCVDRDGASTPYSRRRRRPTSR